MEFGHLSPRTERRHVAQGESASPGLACEKIRRAHVVGDGNKQPTIAQRLSPATRLAALLTEGHPPIIGFSLAMWFTLGPLLITGLAGRKTAS
jgi:hypothetical protein